MFRFFLLYRFILSLFLVSCLVFCLVRCSVWRSIGWIFFTIWTSSAVDLDVGAIFFVMDLDGVRKIRGNNVCDRVHRWFLLFNRVNGHTGKPHSNFNENHSLQMNAEHTKSRPMQIKSINSQMLEMCFHHKYLTLSLSSSLSHTFQSLKVYISEIASPDIRGSLSAIQKIAGHVGVLISFTLGAYLDWRQLAMLIAIAPLLLFITVINIPETPSFLVLNGRDAEAYRYDNSATHQLHFHKLNYIF